MGRCTARGLREYSLKFELNPFSVLVGDVLTRLDNKNMTDGWTKLRGVIEKTHITVF